MKRTTLWLITLGLLGLVLGFILTLALHWQLRPEADERYQIEDIPLDLSSIDSNSIDPSETKQELKEIEDVMFKLTEEHRIAEGHARALVSEMQVYRNSESQLLASIEEQKETLSQKIAELDLKIASSIAQNALTPPKQDYELVAELSSLLAYPHPLNDSSQLNQALLAQPKKSFNTVNARFEIMLQPEDYNATNTIYDALDRLQAAKKESDLNFTTNGVFCSAQACELQFEIEKPSSYFDSWRWLIDYLLLEPAFKTVSHQFSAASETSAIGLIIIPVAKE